MSASLKHKRDPEGEVGSKKARATRASVRVNASDDDMSSTLPDGHVSPARTQPEIEDTEGERKVDTRESSREQEGEIALDLANDLAHCDTPENQSVRDANENEAENQQSDGIAAELSNLELQVKSVLNTLAEVTETVKRLNSEVPPVLERMYANASADVAESMRAHASLRKTALQVQKIEHLLAQAMRGPPEELSMKPI